MAPRIGGEIDRVDGGSLTYAQFVERYMKPNVPVVLTGLTGSWPSRTDWVLEDDNPNLRFFSSLCPNSTVQVADCDKKEYSDQKRVEMTVADFIRGWVEGGCGGGNPSDQPESFLYLKDWHFVKEYPDYCAYSTPAFFMDDWLNTYLDSHTLYRDSDISPHQNEANCADYRFVYMGPKGQSHVHGHLYMLMCLGHIAGQQMCAVKSIGSFYRLLNLTCLFIGMVNH